jgi:hypothetical protein
MVQGRIGPEPDQAFHLRSFDMYHRIISWLESHVGTCAFREHTGIDCPGCGLQRSIIALLKGDVIESILLFPALLPLVTMFAFLGIHLVLRIKHGAFILKILYISNAFLILGNFIIKIIIH